MVFLICFIFIIVWFTISAIRRTLFDDLVAVLLIPAFAISFVVGAMAIVILLIQYKGNSDKALKALYNIADSWKER